jgi:hypothetical protein
MSHNRALQTLDCSVKDEIAGAGGMVKLLSEPILCGSASGDGIGTARMGTSR